MNKIYFSFLLFLLSAWSGSLSAKCACQMYITVYNHGSGTNYSLNHLPPQEIFIYPDDSITIRPSLDWNFCNSPSLSIMHNAAELYYKDYYTGPPWYTLKDTGDFLLNYYCDLFYIRVWLHVRYKDFIVGTSTANDETAKLIHTGNGVISFIGTASNVHDLILSDVAGRRVYAEKNPGKALDPGLPGGAYFYSFFVHDRRYNGVIILP